MSARARTAAVLLTVGMLVLGLLAPAGGTEAGDSTRARVGRNFRVSGPGAIDDAVGPAIAHNLKTDQYLVVWQDRRDRPNYDWDVYGRRVGGNGKTVGADFEISKSELDGSSPDVAYHQAGKEYLVVWTQGVGQDRGFRDIYGRRLSRTGKPLGAPFRVSDRAATGDEAEPKIAYNPVSREYLVVWRDGRKYMDRGEDIYGRRLAADGTPLGRAFRVVGRAATGRDWTPDVECNSKHGTCLVAWTDPRRGGNDIFGRLVSQAGKPLRSDFRITPGGASGHDWRVDLAYDPHHNSYLAVWQDGRGSALGGADIHGRFVQGNGEVAGGDFRLSGKGAIAHDNYPAVSYHRTERAFLVVWVDGRALATRGYDIYGRLLSRTGFLYLTGPFRVVNGAATGNQSNPAVAANRLRGDWLAVWDDGRPNPVANSDIYGQRIEP